MQRARTPEAHDTEPRDTAKAGVRSSVRARRAWTAFAALPVALGLALAFVVPAGWTLDLGPALMLMPLIALWALVGLGKVVCVARRRGARAAAVALATGLGSLALLRATSELPVAWRVGPSARLLLWREQPVASPHVLTNSRFVRRMFVREDASRATPTDGTLMLLGRAQEFSRGTTERGGERGPGGEPYLLVHHVAGSWWYVVLEGEGW